MADDATRQPPADGQRTFPMRSMSPRAAALAASVGAIWLAVLLASIFAPDFVSGSEQEHIPLAAFVDWFWGVVATAFVLMTHRPGTSGPRERSIWVTFAAIVVTFWAVATIAGIFAPVFETGTDPTRIPIAAMIGPFAATLATGFAAVWAAGARDEE